MLIRGMLFENWRPSLIWQVTDRSKKDFTMRVEKEFGDEALGDPDKAVAAVFRLIDKHISPGEAPGARRIAQVAARLVAFALRHRQQSRCPEMLPSTVACQPRQAV